MSGASRAAGLPGVRCHGAEGQSDDQGIRRLLGAGRPDATGGDGCLSAGSQAGRP